MLVRGDAGIKDLSGPVGIVSTITQVGQESENALDALENILYFTALIAVNLAVMNLLPLPALDGGRVLFLTVDAVAMASCRSLPWSISTVGDPHSSRRNRMEQRDSWLNNMERESSVKIGMTPESRGIPKSCMGTVARSESIMVSTNSLGSNSPICRLPMSRSPAIMRK